MASGDRHPTVRGLIKKEPKEIGEFEQTLHPRDYRVFAGVIDLEHWPAWGRLLFKALGGHADDKCCIAPAAHNVPPMNTTDATNAARMILSPS